MAPEQARGELDRIGASSDIFALGGVLYFLLTGQAPFGGETLKSNGPAPTSATSIAPRCMPGGSLDSCERFVLKAMAPEPNRRYATAGEMARALDAFLHRPAGWRCRLGPWCWLPWRCWVVIVGTTAPMSKSNALAAEVPDPRSPSENRRGCRGPFGVAVAADRSLQVELHRRSPGDPAGWIGVDAFESRLTQDARVEARLSKPAYCYLIALNPDGSTQLCYPEKPEASPSAKSAIDYPSDPRSGFGLTDGVGTQAFVLVASAKQLPPFADWSRSDGGPALAAGEY